MPQMVPTSGKVLTMPPATLRVRFLKPAQALTVRSAPQQVPREIFAQSEEMAHAEVEGLFAGAELGVIADGVASRAVIIDTSPSGIKVGAIRQ